MGVNKLVISIIALAIGYAFSGQLPAMTRKVMYMAAESYQSSFSLGAWNRSLQSGGKSKIQKVLHTER